MALFSELPVYKLGYDLLLQLYERSASFSREYKFTLGEKLKNEATELLLNIYKANKSSAEEKQLHIENARQNIEVLRLMLRLCKDLKVLGIKAFVFLNIKVEELSKQLASWQKYSAGVHA